MNDQRVKTKQKLKKKNPSTGESVLTISVKFVMMRNKRRTALNTFYTRFEQKKSWVKSISGARPHGAYTQAGVARGMGYWGGRCDGVWHSGGVHAFTIEFGRFSVNFA